MRKASCLEAIGMTAMDEQLMSSSIDWKPVGERFSILAARWNVDEAKRILASSPRPIRAVSIASMAGYVKRPTFIDTESGQEVAKMEPGREYHIDGGIIHVDYESIDNIIAGKPSRIKIDLTVPIILVTTEFGVFPIDGWHRIALALELGDDALPYVLLTREESEQIRD